MPVHRRVSQACQGRGRGWEGHGSCTRTGRPSLAGIELLKGSVEHLGLDYEPVPVRGGERWRAKAKVASDTRARALGWFCAAAGPICGYHRVR